MPITADLASGLRDTIRGRVLVVGDEGYDAARSVWNAMIDRWPAAVVRPLDTSDVRASVLAAVARGLPVSVRGGGHNVAGHAVGDGALMLDLSELRGVEVDPVTRVAHVGGGATWGAVDAATQAHGLATPGGLISETGVGGLTLSGGIGWLRSAHGLAIDNLVGAEVVTADGSIVQATPDGSHADLLWALRGGGGNFGVVTRFDFALHRVGPTVSFCGPVYDLEAGAGPIRFWRDFLADKHDRVGSLVEFSTIPASPDYPEQSWGRRVYTVAAMFAGDGAEGETLLAPLRAQGPLVTDFSGQMAYVDVQRLFDAVAPFGAYRSYWKSRYLATLDDATIDGLLAHNARPPSSTTLSSIWNFGAATARVPAEATAFGDRSMSWMASFDSMWTDPADDAGNIAWTRAGWDALAPWAAGNRIYLNFPGHGEDADLTAQAFGAANLARLRAVKRCYDPTNVFRFNANIEP
ncbi:MAG: FAD-binding oxidoreductase [Chloroflexi bacterium]|nr:FAD-binding oxidoreductase [Chloroflexota bacterium]